MSEGIQKSEGGDLQELLRPNLKTEALVTKAILETSSWHIWAVAHESRASLDSERECRRIQQHLRIMVKRLAGRLDLAVRALHSVRSDLKKVKAENAKLRKAVAQQ